jgi:CHAT domain-containing protein/Tfp pilus assembly protein PilF
MEVTARAPLVAIVLFMAAAVRAQTPPMAPGARAQELLSRTKAGQEGDVVCGELDEAVGNALLHFAEQAGGASNERLTVAFRLAERAGRCAGWEPLVGAALNGLSNVLLGRGQFDRALAVAEESVRIHQSLPGSGLAEAWNRVGNAHYWLNDPRAALEDFHRALDLSTSAEDRLGQARVWNNIGNVHKSVGALDLALDSYTRAHQTLEDIGDRARDAVVTNNIGLVYFYRGEYATALEYNRRALELNRAVGDQVHVAASLDSLGNIYRALGAYRLALQSFQQALTIRTSLDERTGVMETSHNIGLVHFSQGDYELAIDAYKRGLRLNRALHDQSFAAKALRNIGAAAWRLGQRERAAANFRESLAIAQRQGLRTDEGEVLHDLGQMSLVDGRIGEASHLFDRSLEVRRRVGDQAGITETLTSMASARLAERRHGLALDLAQQAAGNAAVHDQPELLWEAQTVAGQAYRRLRRPDDARSAFSESIRSIEQLSAQVVSDESLSQRFFEDKLSPYHELIALLVEERSSGEAFELAERSKARLLTQLLRGNRADENPILADNEKRERARLRGALLSLNRQTESEQAKPARDESRLNALESARRSSREDLAAFEASLAGRHPELAAARGEVKPVTLADVTHILNDRTTAIVEYVVTGRELFALLLTSDGARVTVDGRAIDIGAAELARRTERFGQQVRSRDFGFADDARALYHLLLEPFKGRLAGKSRLIVVPDGPLWNVPFQALLSPDGYVIEAAAVSYTPSLTVLRKLLQLPRPARPRTLLAMAKSQFGPVSQSGLDPLPEAETQVRLIRDIYGPSRSVTYIGSEATETQFKAAAPHYTVLHLATHGVLDEASPLYSHLVLSPAGGNPDDDGRLEAWEIMRMKLTADLVVLAACDTGRGRIAPGEGVIGMMWALFAAGARSMVVSQFRVESKSATKLLVDFHRRLAAGNGSKTAGLRAAAIELLHTARYAHPYYWAGFILVGDPD